MNVPVRMDREVAICSNCHEIQNDMKPKKCWYCEVRGTFYRRTVVYNTVDRSYDYCAICRNSPMTSKCNNAECDV